MSSDAFIVDSGPKSVMDEETEIGCELNEKPLRVARRTAGLWRIHIQGHSKTPVSRADLLSNRFGDESPVLQYTLGLYERETTAGLFHRYSASSPGEFQIQYAGHAESAKSCSDS